MTATAPRLLPFLIAPLDHADERQMHFVQAGWTRSSAPGRPSMVVRHDDGRPPEVTQQDEGDYRSDHAGVVDRLLAHPRVECHVARPIDVSGVHCGFVVFERAPAVVHYVYTDRSFRRMGVASALCAELAASPASFTHWTPALARMARAGWRMPAQWRWRPLAVAAMRDT
jgi:GNAT superfamily N-acetyltransferase